MSSPPATLGQYQIIREIARSNDIVYEAYDPLMNRRVAIKELAMPQGASGPQQEERINRFKREAQAAGTLNHPNIMTVFSFSEDAGRTFMAMEYLDGGTLRNEIDTKGFIPVERAVEIILQVLDGLGHAHSKGVIHRDIKPDNIQILSNGTIKITDFGIARLTFQPNLTMDGQVFGTPSYMSPEQVVGREIDQRSDLFSVGVVLYEMISGQKPFSGDSVVLTTYAIMNTEATRPAQADPALWEVIRKALDKSPQMRFANADEMSQAVKDSQAPSQSGIAGAVAGPFPTQYGSNPRLTPPPIPQAAMPVYTFNPYMQHPAVPPPPMPYQTTPYQQAQYQTTPYQSPAYQTAPYQSAPYGFQPAPPQAFPIYYPPPPRTPLIKAETLVFLKNLCLWFLLLGTLVVLVIVGMSVAVDALHNARNDAKDDNHLPASLANLPATMPVLEKIRRASDELGADQSDGRRVAIRYYISRLYDDSGRSAMDGGRPDQAEADFRAGIQSYSGNPILWSDLALVTEQSAQHSDSTDYGSMLVEAGDDWSKAYSMETNARQKQEDVNGAVRSYLAFGDFAIQSGDRSQMEMARGRLYSAREMAGQDQDLDSKVKDMLGKLSQP